MQVDKQSREYLTIQCARLDYKTPLAYILLAIAFFAMISKVETGVSGSRDEVVYHYRTIIDFTEQFPNLDLRNYHSATTPLYHVFLTFAALVVGTDLVTLRFINAIISLILLFSVFIYLSRKSQTPFLAFILTLAFMMSPYFIRSSIMLFTDNMAIVLTLLSIMMLDTSVVRVQHFVWSGLFIFLTVLTRQVYAWLIGAFVVASLQAFYKDKEWALLLRSVWPAVFPVAGLAFFVVQWGGLIPVRFLGRHEASALNWEVPAYIISLIGLYGAVFAPWYLRLYRENRRRWKAIHLGGLVALGVGYLLINPISSSADYPHREVGGALWLLTTGFPVLFSSSLVFWILFPLGLIWLYSMLQHLTSRKDYLVVSVLPLWLIANMTSAITYQRYYDLFSLFVILYSLATVKVKHWYDWIGPVGLLALLTGMSVYKYIFPLL